MEHWPGEWTAKAYSLAWFVLLGATPMIMMFVLYSRVIYSLWIKQEVHHQGAQQVSVKHSYYAKRIAKGFWVRVSKLVSSNVAHPNFKFVMLKVQPLLLSATTLSTIGRRCQ